MRLAGVVRAAPGTWRTLRRLGACDSEANPTQ